jgi:threonylcarbamoyladenosine tRNA methylthiotransferase MtaB
MTSFAIQNFGCRVNQAEAFAWAEELQKTGLRLGAGWDGSDYVLVNSCTLTRRADRDVKRFIRKVSRTNPKARLIVTGCYAERVPGDIEGLPGVWMVVGNGGKEALAAKILENAGTPSAPQAAVAPCGTDAAYRARAFVKIQDGCDFRCAYCVIPSVRGRSVSVGEDEVLTRIETLAVRGYREIILAGIHLSSYGLDLRPRGSLAGLVGRIGGSGIPARIRLSSLDPRFVEGPLAERLASGPGVAPHFHLSLQSGSAKVLRAMGRTSDPAANFETLERFRAASPGAALGADIIVGFPGETDEDFEETHAWIARSPLTYVHVFPFSPREGTPASRLTQVDEATRNRRAAALRALSRAKGLEFRKNQTGRELEAVVIGKTGDGATALTGNAIEVSIAECPVPRRERVIVRIVGVSDGATSGEIVRNS